MPVNSAHHGPKRRAYAAVAAVGIAIAALLVIDLIEYRRQAIDKARAVSDNLTRLLSERLDGSVREVDYVLRDLADDARSMSAARLDAKRYTLPNASALAVLDAWGNVSAASPSSADFNPERSCLRAFVADGALNETTQAVFDRLSGGGFLVRARAIRYRDGSLAAIVTARIDLSVIRAELADLDLGDSRVIAITDSELRLIARRPEMPDVIGVEVVDAAMRSLLRSLKEAGAGMGTMRSETGPYFYYAREGEFPFIIAIGEERSSVEGEWYNHLVIYSCAFVIIVFLMILLLRLMSKNFSRSSELAARLVAMESASDAIVIADLEGRAEYVNQSFERISGMPRSEAIGTRKAIFGLEEADADAALQAAASGESWRGEINAVRADGESIVEEVTIAPVSDDGGRPIRLVAVLRDVTERRRLQERLERLAHYDPLTALPNRALFFDRLESAVARARREERRFALLFIDLDGFKAVNDRFGHDAGDYLLFEIARRLRVAIRDSDTAGRMGGDEFTVLLENISKPEDATAVADKIRSALVEPTLIPSGAKVSVGASVGVAVFPDDGEDGEAVLKAADSAMYAIKLATGDRR
jgi:diguanylate cyclase (GGDEF)-like protein/PAS domain S-box-containing protein